MDLFTGQALNGGRIVAAAAPLGQFPLYLRAGTAIGFNARTPDVWAHGWATGALSTPGLAGWMYAPGGGGRGGRAGAAAAVSSGPGTLTGMTAGGQVRLTLRGAPAHAQVLVLATHPPRAVTVDGRALPEAPSAAALRKAGEGWTYSPGAFGGVTVKLAPAHGEATVTVR